MTEGCHHYSPAAVTEGYHHYSPAAVTEGCHHYSPAAVTEGCHQYSPAAVTEGCHHYSPVAVTEGCHHYSPVAVRQGCQHCSFKLPALLNDLRPLARAPPPCTRVTQLSTSHFPGRSRFRAKEKAAVKAVARCNLQFSTQFHYNRSVRRGIPDVRPECAGIWNNCFIDLLCTCLS